jgi:hypothetical protein
MELNNPCFFRIAISSREKIGSIAHTLLKPSLFYSHFIEATISVRGQMLMYDPLAVGGVVDGWSSNQN